MKTKLFTLMMLTVIALASFTSCSDDDSGPRISAETQALRDKYSKTIVGNWYYEENTETSKQYQMLTILDNGKVSYSYRVEGRQLVYVDGKQVMTDWMTIGAKTGSGTWQLNYNVDLKKDCLDIYAEEVNSGKTNKASYNLEFAYANSDFLFVQPIPFLGTDVTCFKRMK